MAKYIDIISEVYTADGLLILGHLVDSNHHIQFKISSSSPSKYLLLHVMSHNVYRFIEAFPVFTAISYHDRRVINWLADNFYALIHKSEYPCVGGNPVANYDDHN